MHLPTFFHIIVSVPVYCICKHLHQHYRSTFYVPVTIVFVNNLWLHTCPHVLCNSYDCICKYLYYVPAYFPTLFHVPITIVSINMCTWVPANMHGQHACTCLCYCYVDLLTCWMSCTWLHKTWLYLGGLCTWFVTNVGTWFF